MSKLTEEQLNQISYRIAGLNVLVEDSSAAEKNSALEEAVKSNPQSLLENMRQTSRVTLTELEEEDRLMDISKRIAGIR